MLPPRTSRRGLATAVAAVLLLSACGGADDTAEDPAGTGASEDVVEETADDAATDEGSDNDDAMDGDAMADDDAMDDGDAAADADDGPTGVLAVTATAPDGATFAIADFEGPVLVETFATWCSTCRRQLADTQRAAVEAGDDAAFLVLSVETTLDPATLAEYAAENGFDDLVFGVLDEQGLVVLQEEFGGTVLNPPSTPKFRVEGGEVSGLTTGPESAGEILASLGV